MRAARVLEIVGAFGWREDCQDVGDGAARITGAVTGAAIPGVPTSGFAFLNVEARSQEIVKGAAIIAAVSADQRRGRERRKA